MHAWNSTVFVLPNYPSCDFWNSFRIKHPKSGTKPKDKKRKTRTDCHESLLYTLEPQFIRLWRTDCTQSLGDLFLSSSPYLKSKRSALQQPQRRSLSHEMWILIITIFPHMQRGWRVCSRVFNSYNTITLILLISIKGWEWHWIVGRACFLKTLYCFHCSNSAQYKSLVSSTRVDGVMGEIFALLDGGGLDGSFVQGIDSLTSATNSSHSYHKLTKLKH